MLRKAFFALLLAVSFNTAISQVATGIYPHGTFDNKGFDTINVGNLNIHASIPIINKSGRGLPFWYNLSFDSSVWYSTTVSGAQVWTPVGGFGWKGDTELATGYVSYFITNFHFTSPDGENFIETIYNNFVYHDPFGNQHWFTDSAVNMNCIATGYSYCNDSAPSFTQTAIDGSGYVLSVSNYTTTTLTSVSGKNFAVPSTSTGTAHVTDSNGNEVSVDGNGHFTDTTGVTVLTVGGGAPNPETLTYKDANGSTQTVNINYKTYTVQTAFGCPGIGEYGPQSTSLVDNVTFPDGSAYRFTYEGTPGVSGNVTGRIASVMLPQGGTINYSYSGGNNGIVCSEGSTAGLTRSISADSQSAASTWTYTRTVGTGTSHTNETDGLNNHNAYDFVKANSSTISAVYYETNRVVNQGTSTQLLSRQTCYNGVTANCTTSAFTLPISQIDISEALNSSGLHGSTVKYNSNGSQTERDDYDFGSASSRGALLRKEVWTYGGGIVGLITLDQVYDGAGHLSNQTNYGYDETTGTGHAALSGTSGLPSHIAASGPRGNLTTISQMVDASGTTLKTMAAYEDTGDVLNSTSPNGKTTFAYDSTHAFASTVTPPTPSSGVSLATSATYDLNTGLITGTTDPNGTRTQYLNYDAFGRVGNVNIVDSGNNAVSETAYHQLSPVERALTRHQNASVFTFVDPLVDAYGRSSRFAIANNSSLAVPFYIQDTCYDANGNVSFKSYRYAGGANGAVWSTPKVCSGAGDTYTYDALDRVKSITHADGTSFQYTYTGRATKVTDQNGVSKITQVDGLGRQTGVCEISSNGSMPGSGSPTSCGMDIPGTGFVTSYSYDLANHKTTVTQGLQQRIFQTDWLGRTILTQEPERGQTTYSYAYNGTGLVLARTRPRANQTNVNILTTTTTQYDSVGRIVSISYSDGTPTKSFAYDQATIWGSSSVSTGASKGRMTSAFVPTSNNYTAEAYVYDAMGDVTGNLQCLPSTCGVSPDKWLYYTYDWLGNMLTATDGAGVTTSYSYTEGNEVQSITSSKSDATHPATLVSNAQHGPFGPTSYTMGNGLSISYTYDSLGRVSQFGTGISGYTSSWNGMRQLGGCDTSLNQCVGYGYDEFDRLNSRVVSTGSLTNFGNYSYVYDRYGNRWQQNAIQGGGNNFSASYDTTTNHINSAGYIYDAAGNMIADGLNQYSYDAEGNLIQEITPSGPVKYTYDALNQQVRTDYNSTSAVEVVFNLSGQLASLWLVGTGDLLTGKAYWGSTAIESYETAQNMAYFPNRDWLGTIRTVTDATGTITDNTGSLPFGDDTLNTFGGRDNSFDGFIGLWDGATSITKHAQYREYANSQGRWLQPDPYDGSYDFSNPQSFNRYSYALNNPLSLVDPLGLQDCEGAAYSDDGYSDCYDGVGSLTCPPGTVGDQYGNCYPINDNGSITNPNPITVGVGGDGYLPCGNFGCAPGGYSPTGSTNAGGGAFVGSPGSKLGAAPSNGQVPVHGPWTYGNHCGAGGMGPDINRTDAACHVHDDCFDSIHLTADQYTSGNLTPAQVQGAAACNQQLCNSVLNVNRGSGIPFSQRWTGAEIILFFSLTGPKGAQCHGF